MSGSDPNQLGCSGRRRAAAGTARSGDKPVTKQLDKSYDQLIAGVEEKRQELQDER